MAVAQRHRFKVGWVSGFRLGYFGLSMGIQGKSRRVYEGFNQGLVNGHDTDSDQDKIYLVAQIP
jgi:hypothetical protein